MMLILMVVVYFQGLWLAFIPLTRRQTTAAGGQPVGEPDAPNPGGHKTYDVILLGGGCSAMQWLHGWHYSDQGGSEPGEMSASPRMLVVDSAGTPARTWCFWAKHSHIYDPVVSHRWEKLRFMAPQGGKEASIAPYSYQYISGADFFERADEVVEAIDGVESLEAEVEATERVDQRTRVITDQGVVEAPQVYSSIIDRRKIAAASQERERDIPGIWQHFRGWFLETEEEAFDPEVATLMDFRTAQEGGVVFFYLLPFSERRALVECTVFGPQIWDQEAYDERLQQYIDTHLPGAREHRVYRTEQGQIPMTMADMEQFRFEGTQALGTAAGMVKPTTGYMFKRSMLATLRAFAFDDEPRRPRWESPDRFEFYDRLLLGIIEEEPEKVAAIMHALFTRNDMRQVLRFLDEESTVAQDAKMFATLPYTPFLKQVVKQHVSRLLS